MSERGTLRIVVEGKDAQLFHEALMDFVAKSKEYPDYQLEDPVCESYWKITLGDTVREAEENSCFLDCYSSKDEFKGYVTIYWDDYKYEDGLVRLTATWFNTLGFISLVSFLIENEDNYYYEYMSFNWGIGTNDAESKYFEKIVDVIDWDPDTVPDDWNKDWDRLSFEERIALCDKHEVMYMATRID